MTLVRTIITLLLVLQTFSAPYRTKLASQLTYLSAIAYRPSSAITSWNCDLCYYIKVLHPKIVSNSSIFGFTGYAPQIASIIVAFRGTVDTSNWMLNIKTTRQSYPLCKDCFVHSGFNQGFESIKYQLDSNLKNLMKLYPYAKIVLTGHSLGGALALLAAAYIHSIYVNVDQLYTMGQPRVGNNNFAQFMTNLIPNTFRIVNYADVVPRIPQSILGFKHSGFQVWYERGMQQYTICPSQRMQCSHQLSLYQLTKTDHKISLYLQLYVQDELTVLHKGILFRQMATLTHTKIFDLNEQTQLDQDRKVKQVYKILEQEQSANAK